MRFTKEDYKTLYECIQETGVDLQATKTHYLFNNIGNNPEVRFVWDIFWRSKWSIKYREADLKEGYLDTHIETATRKAIKELMKVHRDSNKKLATRH